MTQVCEVLRVSDQIRVKLMTDDDAEMPEDDVFHIAHASRGVALGDQHVSKERLDEISAGIRSGKLLGWPVYAYVHSGATIRMSESGNPFSCPWDSGQCGLVYCDKAAFLAAVGRKRLTPKAVREAREQAKAVVEEFDAYLTGDVYGAVVERVDDSGDATQLDSVWGLVGRDYALSEAKSLGESHI